MLTSVFANTHGHRYEQLELAAALVAGTGGNLAPSKLAKEFPPMPPSRRFRPDDGPASGSESPTVRSKRLSLQDKLSEAKDSGGRSSQGSSNGAAGAAAAAFAVQPAAEKERHGAGVAEARSSDADATGGRRSHEEVLDASLKKVRGSPWVRYHS